MRRGWFASILVIAALPFDASVYALTPEQQDRPPNVVLISLDTVRPDHLSCYGYHRETSANIDAVAREGAVFTQAFGQGFQTFPSHLSIFTSRYPLFPWLVRKVEDVTPKGETLTEVLRGHGYATASFTHLDKVDEIRTHPAFASFEHASWKNQLSALPEELFTWLIDHRDVPFFLFVHGFDAHGPHVLPSEAEAKRFSSSYTGRLASTIRELKIAMAEEGLIAAGNRIKHAAGTDELAHLAQLGVPGEVQPEDLAHLIALYDAQIYRLDRGLGRLFDALRRLEIMDRTLLVIVSDHGEAFGEHGHYARHGSPYRENVQTALIIRDPRIVPPQRKIGSLVQLIDVMPTILELVGSPVPASAQGRSLVPLLQTGKDPGREEVAVSVNLWRAAIRTPEWKLITSRKMPTELYHVVNDPEETQDVAGGHPELTAGLIRHLETLTDVPLKPWRNRFKAWNEPKSYW